MKRNLKGKLILSIATLGLACASTIGSTYAWFVVNSAATASGVDMKANSGTGLYIRNGHSGTFSDKAEIKSLSGAKWEPVTGATTTSGTTSITLADKFVGTFVTYSGIDSSDNAKLTYTALSSSVAALNSTDVFGISNDSTTYTAYYYCIEMDYMITTGKKLNIQVTDVTVDDTNATVKQATASIAQAARVAFFPATGDWSEITSAPTYSTTDGVQEYCLTSSTTSTDYNLEQLKALGYTGTTGDYKLSASGARKGLIDSTYTNSTHTNKKTTDTSFTYGSVKIFVWFDGTDYACSNALMDQKLTFNFKFTVGDTITSL